jgi:hypothetical protein
MGTTPAHLVVDARECLISTATLAKSLDLPVGDVAGEATLHTINELAEAAYELLRHVEALIDAEAPRHLDGIGWSADDLALLRTTMAEFGDGTLDLDDYRRAIALLSRPAS